MDIKNVLQTIHFICWIAIYPLFQQLGPEYFPWELKSFNNFKRVHRHDSLSSKEASFALEQRQIRRVKQWGARYWRGWNNEECRGFPFPFFFPFPTFCSNFYEDASAEESGHEWSLYQIDQQNVSRTFVIIRFLVNKFKFHCIFRGADNFR